MDEVDLIQAARGGDLDSFNHLVLAYQDLIFDQAYRMMGERPSAEDVTQEAFISAFRKLNSYRNGSFRAWLLRIVTNACYDRLRREKRQLTTPLEPLSAANEEIESPRWLADLGKTPEELAERAELSKALQQCLERLQADYRTVVILVDIQGLDYAEAALSIRKPVGTIKSRLARARMRLRDCLKAFFSPGTSLGESEVSGSLKARQAPCMRGFHPLLNGVEAGCRAPDHGVGEPSTSTLP